LKLLTEAPLPGPKGIWEPVACSKERTEVTEERAGDWENGRFELSPWGRIRVHGAVKVAVVHAWTKCYHIEIKKYSV
jgi:hypothetical protein